MVRSISIIVTMLAAPFGCSSANPTAKLEMGGPVKRFASRIYLAAHYEKTNKDEFSDDYVYIPALKIVACYGEDIDPRKVVEVKTPVLNFETQQITYKQTSKPLDERLWLSEFNPKHRYFYNEDIGAGCEVIVGNVLPYWDANNQITTMGSPADRNWMRTAMTNYMVGACGFTALGVGLGLSVFAFPAAAPTAVAAVSFHLANVLGGAALNTGFCMTNLNNFMQTMQSTGEANNLQLLWVYQDLATRQALQDLRESHPTQHDVYSEYEKRRIPLETLPLGKYSNLKIHLIPRMAKAFNSSKTDYKALLHEKLAETYSEKFVSIYEEAKKHIDKKNLPTNPMESLGIEKGMNLIANLRKIEKQHMSKFCEEIDRFASTIPDNDRILNGLMTSKEGKDICSWYNDKGLFKMMSMPQGQSLRGETGRALLAKYKEIMAEKQLRKGTSPLREWSTSRVHDFSPPNRLLACQVDLFVQCIEEEGKFNGGNLFERCAGGQRNLCDYSSYKRESYKICNLNELRSCINEDGGKACLDQSSICRATPQGFTLPLGVGGSPQASSIGGS